jgi:transposase
MRHDEKEKIALWRVGVLGPLISARLEHGDRRRYIEEVAARLHQQPDGTYVQLSPRTIESWYYAYRHGGFQALFPQDRADRGRSRAITAEIAEHILRVKRERPRRSIRRIIRMLERAQIVTRDTLHCSTVHRLLRAHQLSCRPQRYGGTERRSFLPEHAGDLWVGDALHGPGPWLSPPMAHCAKPTCSLRSTARRALFRTVTSPFPRAPSTRSTASSKPFSNMDCRALITSIWAPPTSPTLSS